MENGEQNYSLPTAPVEAYEDIAPVPSVDQAEENTTTSTIEFAPEQTPDLPAPDLETNPETPELSNAEFNEAVIKGLIEKYPDALINNNGIVVLRSMYPENKLSGNMKTTTSDKIKGVTVYTKNGLTNAFDDTDIVTIFTTQGVTKLGQQDAYGLDDLNKKSEHFVPQALRDSRYDLSNANVDGQEIGKPFSVRRGTYKEEYAGAFSMDTVVLSRTGFDKLTEDQQANLKETLEKTQELYLSLIHI